MKPVPKRGGGPPEPASFPPRLSRFSRPSGHAVSTRQTQSVPMFQAESYLPSAIFFGIVSVFLLLYYLARPSQAPARPPENGGNAFVRAGPSPTAAPSATRNRDAIGDALGPSNASETRRPSHVLPSIRLRPHGANVLVDGLVAFRFTKAAAAASASVVASDAAARDRKDRARILSRILEQQQKQKQIAQQSQQKSSKPAEKGALVVVAIPAADASCSLLKRVLFILGSYYNLLVILVVDNANADNNTNSIDKTIQTLGLDPQVVPEHRIVAASSATARVALVRQLQSVAVVLDFDADVQTQLGRFGHPVVLYNNHCDTTTEAQQESQLGRMLLG